MQKSCCHCTSCTNHYSVDFGPVNACTTNVLEASPVYYNVYMYIHVLVQILAVTGIRENFFVESLQRALKISMRACGQHCGTINDTSELQYVYMYTH